MTLTTNSTSVIQYIESKAGKIPATVMPQLLQSIEDGLESNFIEDAGIETIEQHLEDVMERLKISLDATKDYISTPQGKTAAKNVRYAIKLVNKTLSK